MSQQAPSGDWVSQVVGLIDRYVGALNTKATRPIIKIVRGIVYGVIAACLGVMALILLAIAAVRGLVQLTGAIFTHEQAWLAEVLVGAVFLLGGLLLLSRRHASTD
jgi:hypothetical protein